MIKHMAILFGAFLCVGLSSTAFAGASAWSAGVLTVNTTSSATCPGPAMTYTPSPSTLMSSFTSATAYTIASASSKTDTNNGMEYGILSTNEGYFQRAQTAAGVVPVCASATLLPAGTAWKDKNGSEP